MNKIVLIPAFFVIAFTINHAQTGKNISTYGLLQPVYRVNLSSSAHPNNEFYLNRLRFGIESKVLKSSKAELELDPLDPLLVKDAVIKFNLSKNFELKVGKFKKSFSFERLTSVKDLPFIERTKIVKELDDLDYTGRDIGIQVSYSTNSDLIDLKISAGVFNGNSMSLKGDNNNSKSFVQRFEFSTGKIISAGINSSQKFDSLSGKYFTANGFDFIIKPTKNSSFVSEFLIGKKNSNASIGGFYSFITYEINDFTLGLRFSQYYKDIKKSGTNFIETKIDWKPEKFIRIHFNFLSTEKNSNFQNEILIGVTYEI